MERSRARLAGDAGQASPEWIALVLVVALAFAGLLALGVAVPGVGLARAVAARMACAVRLGGCAKSAEDPFVAVYGAEVATKLHANAPKIRWEEGMRALPVDFRSCREDACSVSADGGGEVSRSLSGEPATVFVHAVDCRPDPPPEGFDCSGDRAGNLYLQYWLYYAGSQTSRELLGKEGFHNDDWEGMQVRIGPGGAESRATSHHGYNYRGGALNWASDLGAIPRSAWGPATGAYFVSGGSHAGHVKGGWADSGGHVTAASELRLIPIESLDPSARRTNFAITPPWRKYVYRDPEYQGTD